MIKKKETFKCIDFELHAAYFPKQLPGVRDENLAQKFAWKHTHTHTNNSDFSDFLMDHKNEMQKQEEDIKNRSPSALKG